MAIFPDTLIDNVRRQLDPEAILRRIDYLPEMINDTGRTIKCFCPIHKETIFRTLIIDKPSGTYQCGNSNCPGRHGGDLIDLYAKTEDLSYEQALLELSEHFGVQVDMKLIEKYIQAALEVARNYLDMGVLAEAEEHFDRILRFKGDCIPAQQALVEIYQATDRSEQVELARLRLARIHARAGHPNDALQLLEGHVRNHPENTDLRLEYIDCLRQAGQLDRAAGEYINFADDLAARGEPDRALEIYRAAQELGSNVTDVSIHIIKLLQDSGRQQEAVAETLDRVQQHLAGGDRETALAGLESALEMDPDREDLVVRMAQIITDGRLGGDPLARVCDRIAALLAARSNGPAGRALDLLETAFADRPRLLNLRAHLEEARGNLDQALDLRLQCVDQYQQRHMFEEALEVLRHTMAHRDENVALMSREAGLLRELGRTEDAVQVYLQIVELFQSAEEYEHAAAVYQTIIQIQPDHIPHREHQFELYLRLGMEPIIAERATALAEAYRQRDQLDEAGNVLHRALQHAPTSVDLLSLHAQLLEDNGRKPEAAEQYIAAVRHLLDARQLDKGRALLNRALKCVPEHLEARELVADVLAAQQMSLQALSIYTDLAEFFLRDNQPERVIEIGQKVLKIQPEHLQTLLLMTRAYGATGHTDKQLALQTRLIQLYTKGQSYTRASELCEEILNQYEDYTPAIEQLVKIAEETKKTDQSIHYLWKLAQVHARAGRRELEQGVLEQILERDPLFPEANSRLLELTMTCGSPRTLHLAVGNLVDRYTAAGRIDEAIQMLEDLRQSPSPKPEILAGLARLHREIGDLDGLKTALRMQAELLGRLLRDKEALAVWDDLAEQQPNDLTIPRTRIEIMLRNNMTAEAADEYMLLADALIARQRFEEAEVALLEVLNLKPRDDSARDRLLTLLVQAGDFQRARDQIEESAAAYLAENRLDEATALYRRILDFNPDDEQVLRKIVAIRQRSGDRETAAQDFVALLDVLDRKNKNVEFEQAAREALKLDPHRAEFRQRLAEFYRCEDRPQEAESELLTLAVQLIQSNQLDEADRVLQRILELNPDSVPGRAQRAELLALRGDDRSALHEFRSLSGQLATLPSAGTAHIAAAPAEPFNNGNYAGIKLNREYTFDSFIVGSRNNFAHAAALAVGRAPARNYNPLFLYSEVGLGKTHLCHAIAAFIVDRHPQLKVLYTSTEEFVAALIDSIQNNEIGTFRYRHKLADTLIVDDVQFLSGKERAQEEFFNVFNALHQAGHQVVLTSDRPPKHISHLEKRLKSRFGAGIIVDIQPPDLETRMAILRRELDEHGGDGGLDDEILLFIAETIDTNVRELKGALNQILARQELSGKPLDLVQTKQVLAHNLTDL